jgi:hypothetical protein
MKIMAEKPKDIKPDEARLREIEVLEREAVVLRRLAVLYGHGAGVAPLPMLQNPAPAADLRYLANLPQIDAILEYLKICKGPKSAKQIWAALEKAGCEVASETPVRSVQWALKKSVRTNPDLVAVGWGHWDLKSKYSKARLDKLLASRAGRGGRSTEEHKKRTLEGMETARKKGRPIGAPAKMTPELMDTIERLILDQRKVAQIAAELGVSKASIYGHFTVARVNGRQTVTRRNVASSAPLWVVK